MSGAYLTGDKGLDLFFATAAAKLQKKIGAKAARETAKGVADKIIELAPQDEGEYVTSIKVRALKRSRRNKYIAGARVVTDEKRLREIAENEGQTFNPHWLEFGTAKAPAQSHFRAGADVSEAFFRSDFRARIRPLVLELAREARTP